jgi:prepilin-type processing-associated H-X9-DG protein
MPIKFTCPHCGATSDVADQYAGQSGPCVHCGKAITIPRPEGDSPWGGGDISQKRGLGAGGIVLAAAIIVLLVCGGILLALLPVVNTPREAARRSQCSNNMKQIALAMLMYENAYQCYPPAFIADKNGKPMHSWRVLILPYMEEKALYHQYRFNEPWDGPHNRTLASQMPRVYACPSDVPPDGSTTSYAMPVGPHAISSGPKGRKISEIRDGTSNTIMVVEAADAGINWMEPRDINAEDTEFQINGDGSAKPTARASEISSRHPNGANVAFCDGSVQFLTSTTDPKTVKAMTTIDGGENVMPPD